MQNMAELRPNTDYKAAVKEKGTFAHCINILTYFKN